MTEVVECEGAPRDLGLDQGRSCRAFLSTAYGSEPPWRRVRFWLGAGSGEARRRGRDLQRFFPAQAEAIEAMARAARVPHCWLIELLADPRRAAPVAEFFALAAGRAVTDEGGLLARNLPADAITRRSRPDHGFSSVELTQPWRTAPLAGVNEAGIAIVCTSEGGGLDRSGCAAPSSLLAQDCLRRFDQLDGAVDWLLTRPGGGTSTLLLADSAGEIIGVKVNGDDRQVFRPADGLIVHTDGPRCLDALVKALHEPPRLDASNLGPIFGTPLVAVDAASRRIALLGDRVGRPRRRQCRSEAVQWIGL